MKRTEPLVFHQPTTLAEATRIMLEGGSGAGFAALTTMAILFGQYLTPRQDLFYSDLYRFWSLSLSVLLSLSAIYLLHLLLDRFAATRWAAPKAVSV